MSDYIESTTESLETLISELSLNPSLFLKNPDVDFTRNRKIDFKTLVGITMNSGGCTMSKKLLDFFDFSLNTPSVSAYTQQRSKVLSEAFEFIFHEFYSNNQGQGKRYEGYQLLACDGSNLTIATNPKDAETVWKATEKKRFRSKMMNIILNKISFKLLSSNQYLNLMTLCICTLLFAYNHTKFYFSNKFC
ncbi:MAG: hypothetical protein PHD70_00275 [Anaerostipes sp.]|nr:hypothetical protein [Anaerostipes sp.]